jgi:hypothetical protein
VPEAGLPVFQCVDCRDYWSWDGLVPDRRLAADDGLTRPLGDPREAGHGTSV